VTCPIHPKRSCSVTQSHRFEVYPLISPCSLSRISGIDLERSFVIGDHPHDIELARNAGANAIYVLSGHGLKHREELPGGTEVAGGIKEAAEIICGRVEAARETENKRHTNT